MSALLKNDTLLINLNAEYYYSSRNFNKVPNVYFADNYRSCMFLVYTNDRVELPNRVKNYRNHFTLYTDGQSVLIVRTETTLIYNDNDAVLTYELIVPSENVRDRYRVTREPWTVSFDRISFSNKRPKTFANYRMLCSGEWWFFDKGFILNGVTTPIVSNCAPQCKSIFIYFELHQMYKITRNKPVISEPIINHIADRVNSDEEPAAKRAKVEQTKMPEDVIVGENDVTRFLSSITSQVMPVQNRQPAKRNDETNPPQVQYMTILPSLYWLSRRADELSRGNISYFIPRNNSCQPDLSWKTRWNKEPTPSLSMFN